MDTLPTLTTKIRSALVLALTALIGFGAGTFYGPESVETKERIVYRESTDTQKNVSVTVKSKQTILPDGTTINESISRSKDKSEIKSDVSLDQTKSTSKGKPMWRVGILYAPKIPTVQDEGYILDVEHRFVSNLFLGAYVSTNKNVGLSLSIGF